MPWRLFWFSRQLPRRSIYYWHRANHRIGWLWRFHNVHHIDPDLDVSTAFRFHFVEVALSAGFRVLQVVLIGPSLAAYAALECVLNKALVTPRMHGIHHSDIREEDLSDFGVVFPWWDRLHGTLRLNVPQSDVTIGVPAYSRAGDNAVVRAFVMPFAQQRKYWTGPAGARIRRQPPVEAAARGRLAA